MELIAPLGIAALVLTAINLLHWRICGQDYHYWPTGWLGFIVNAWLMVLMPLTMLLALVGFFSVVWNFYIMFGFSVLVDIYSIWRRKADATKACRV